MSSVRIVGQFGKKGGQKIFRVLGVVGGFGFLMAATILLGYYVGHFLDQRFGTDPWLMILFLLVGVAFGFIQFFRMTRKLFSSETPRNNG